MKLSKLLDRQYVEVEIQGIKLNFAKLTWGEMRDFQDYAKTISEEDEEDATKKLCVYILDKFVTDEEEDRVIDVEDIEKLPVSFCVDLVAQFLKHITNEDEEDNAKKKHR